MKAIIVKKENDVPMLTWEDAPEPVMTSDDVLVEVKATAELIEVQGRRLIFQVEAHDSVELVGEGTHQRAIISVQRFKEHVAQKAK